MAEHNELGKEGEKEAIAYLKKNGYEILENNYRFKKAEIDIIALKEELVVVEVKTRSTDYFGNPEEFVTSKKKKLLVKAIDNYIIEKDLDVEVRFDIIAIIKRGYLFEVDHIEDAFLFF
ncbi:YraN family protein [Tenacibaculum agarivorans]|uniref:YraN family protein n=1 Tax=Tenacibaculum agarivorans TaxID=1908389 RepID=UPI00094B8402|nr:YraN family protein [Tenacibaculum agarivorans]